MKKKSGKKAIQKCRSLSQMIDDYGLMYTLRYFHMSYHVLTLSMVIIGNRHGADFLCTILGLDNGSRSGMLMRMIHIFTPISLYGIWSYLTFKYLRSRLYTYVTYGRHYAKDSTSFEKTFTELTEFYNDAEPHRMITDGYPVQNWRKCKGINFGYDDEGRAIFLNEDCEYNFAIFGPPGSSKTAGFCNVNAITFPGSCLIVDIKSDIYKYVSSHSKRKIARFCPDDPDALTESFHFDPLLGINSMSVTDRKLKIENIANALIPDDGGNDGNYFPETARIYMRGISHLLLNEDPRTSFPDIVHAILESDYAEWVYRAEESRSKEARELLLSLKGNNEKNVSGAYQNLTKCLNVYSNPVLDELLTYKHSRTLTIHTLDSRYDVYLQISEEHLKPYGPLLTMIITSFSTDFLSRPDTSTGAKNRHVLMMLDELSSLHLSYDLLNVNLSKLRSKSVLSAIILQNVPQITRLYGKDGAMSLLGNCHVQAILGANDPETAEYFSRKLGVKKDYRATATISGPKNSATTSKTVTVDDKVPVYKPEDVADLKAESQNILYVDGKYTFLKKLNCYKD